VAAESYTGSQAGFITDTNHMAAKIIEVKGDRIRAALDAGQVPRRIAAPKPAADEAGEPA